MRLSVTWPLHDHSMAGRTSGDGFRKRAASSVCPLSAIGNEAPIAVRRRITVSRIFLAHQLIGVEVEDADADHGAMLIDDAHMQ